MTINPVEEISFGDVSHKKEQAESSLVEAAISERIFGQGTSANLARMTAGAPGLVVSAVLESPVAVQEGASRNRRKLSFELAPGYAAMRLEVRRGDLVLPRDAS